jgi:cation diffusion facilitator CzcD-associated flavoprotein CzcO
MVLEEHGERAPILDGEQPRNRDIQVKDTDFHSGCDIPTHLYSFSFNLNPSWSKELCDQPEILQYMEATVDKFSLRSHIHTLVECLGAEWHWETWMWSVRFRDLATGIEYTRTANILVSAVSGISFSRDVGAA